LNCDVFIYRQKLSFSLIQPTGTEIAVQVNAKVSPALSYKAPYHIDAWRSAGISPSFFISALMDVGGQLHARAAFTPREEPPLPKV
jgi:hypothetical protein